MVLVVLVALAVIMDILLVELEELEELEDLVEMDNKGQMVFNIKWLLFLELDLLLFLLLVKLFLPLL